MHLNVYYPIAGEARFIVEDFVSDELKPITGAALNDIIRTL